jgi:putative polyhydroxyalkanoate system protein
VPKINIEREHGKASIDDVKTDVQELADRLSEKFDLKCRWNGDSLEFKRTGAEGRIEVDARRVRLVMKLSMLLAPIKGEVEKRTNMYMDQYFEK